jgi:hypothetical protein
MDENQKLLILKIIGFGLACYFGSIVLILILPYVLFYVLPFALFSWLMAQAYRHLCHRRQGPDYATLAVAFPLVGLIVFYALGFPHELHDQILPPRNFHFPSLYIWRHEWALLHNPWLWDTFQSFNETMLRGLNNLTFRNLSPELFYRPHYDLSHLSFIGWTAYCIGGPGWFLLLDGQELQNAKNYSDHMLKQAIARATQEAGSEADQLRSVVKYMTEDRALMERNLKPLQEKIIALEDQLKKAETLLEFEKRQKPVPKNTNAKPGYMDFFHKSPPK